MTVIVYRNGVMACDSRAYSGGPSPIGDKCKIERLEDGTLLGVSSNKPGGAELVRRWYKEECPDEFKYKLPETFTLLAVKPDGTAYYADDYPMLSGPLTADYFAIGSGEKYALGALALGVSAPEAVAIGCKLDVWSAWPIHVINHSGEGRSVEEF